MYAGTGDVTTLGERRSKPHLWALLYIELTSAAHDTSLSLSSVPFWQNRDLNSTRVITRNPSSFANASVPVVTALWAETKQHGLLHGSSYRQVCRLIFKVSDDIASFQWGEREEEEKAKQSFFFLFLLVHDVSSPFFFFFFYHNLKVFSINYAGATLVFMFDEFILPDMKE